MRGNPNFNHKFSSWNFALKVTNVTLGLDSGSVNVRAEFERALERGIWVKVTHTNLVMLE